MRDPQLTASEERQAERAWDAYEAKLFWHKGERRANQILDGCDAEFNADLASWLRLGRKAAA